MRLPEESEVDDDVLAELELDCEVVDELGWDDKVDPAKVGRDDDEDAEREEEADMELMVTS